MSVKERLRVEIFSQVKKGDLTLAAAAVRLNLSYRQAKRIKSRYLKDGDAGLIHTLRGRSSNHQSDDAVRSAVLKLYRSRYAGFGPTLACEYLKKDGREVSHDALGRWLREEGLFEKRRRRGKHRLPLRLTPAVSSNPSNLQICSDSSQIRLEVSAETRLDVPRG